MVTALSTLRTEQKVDRLLETADDLSRAVNCLLGLPEDLLAWPVRTVPETVPELRADLLRPDYRLVPYTGQPFEAMRDDLLAWARRLEDAQPPVGLRTHIGPGGAGKTRLLMEVGEELRQESWWVGFLRAGRLTKDNAPILCADARPTLLIVDYIADRGEEVRSLLRAAAKAADEDKRPAPLAIVLLDQAVEGALVELREREEWRALAEALGRLAAGERDPQALRRGLALDAVDEQALALAERAVTDVQALEMLAALATLAALVARALRDAD
ncbi:MAG: hypothetical protein H5T61_09215 [Thermoflexales bacterium]|nr:hypothetical protein [Thermoflexales bacterium]